MKKGKEYLPTFIEIGATVILLVALITIKPSSDFADNAALIFTLVFTGVYALYAVCYFLAYNDYVFVKWKGNENQKKLMYVINQSVAHLFLGVTIMDYCYSLSDSSKIDLICCSILILSALITIIDFFVRYKKIVNK